MTTHMHRVEPRILRRSFLGLGLHVGCSTAVYVLLHFCVLTTVGHEPREFVFILIGTSVYQISSTVREL